MFWLNNMLMLLNLKCREHLEIMSKVGFVFIHTYEGLVG